jgi:hypothetical protein
MSSSQTPEMKVAKTVKKIIESLTNSHTISDSASHTSTSSVSPVKIVKVVKGNTKVGNIKGGNIKGGNIKGPKINIKTSVAKSTNFIDSIKTNVIKKIMTYVSHPKFKWIVAALLLCTLAFAYFKYQQHIKNKKLKAVKNGPTPSQAQSQTSSQEPSQAQAPAQSQAQPRNNMVKEPIPQQFQQFSNMRINEEAIRKHLEAQLMLQQQQINTVNMMQEKQNSKNQVNVKPGKKQKNVKIVHPEESTTEEESEEIFMEDQNVMTHNLTMDEMNAIDKQLEDVNIDNIVNSD